MARTALIGGNHPEALEYFNRVLEIDPNVSEAWVGKGKAAGWQSTLANFRMGESIIAFKHAIATASEGSKAAVTEEVVGEVNQIVVALYAAARNHMVEYASLDSTWPDYLNQVARMIDALDEIRTWSSGDRTTLDNIIHLCKDNIEGYKFRDKFNNNVPRAYGISDSYERFLRERMDQAVADIRTLEPSYAAPTIEKKKADACFVVTATMGDFNHPKVVLLRRFRDDWLLKKVWGHMLVGAYYRIGPWMAAIIEKSPTLRTLSRRLIVDPVAWFARKRIG
jgi:hypothetical protein